MAAIHHIRLSVSDLDTATRFYSPLLAGLGFRGLPPRLTGKGEIDRLRFEKDGTVLLIGRTTEAGRHERGKPGLHHLAFSVDSRAEVERIYDEVIKNLEHVNVEDPPIDCPEYSEGYYATFFFDPDGIKLKVTFTPE